MTHKEAGLVFFDKLSDAQLQNNFVLSGLQSFETSFFLMGSGLWPSTTLLLWGACEKFLRVATNEYDKNVDAYGLQNIFKKMNPALSDKLHRQSNDFRKTRNDIAHKGYSPKYDAESARLFFEAGVPYFDSLLRYLFEADKTELSGEVSQWFWPIYRDTRKVLEKKRKKELIEFGQSFFYMQIATRRIFQVGSFNRAYSPYEPRLFLLDSHMDDAAFDINEKIFKEAQELMGTNECFNLDDPGCPLCDGNQTLADIEWTVDEATNRVLFSRVKTFMCVEKDCAAYMRPIEDPEVLDIFHTRQVSQSKKEYLESEECQEVQFIY